MHKKILLLALAIVIVVVFYIGLINLAKPTLIASAESPAIDGTKPRVLLTCLAHGLGGAEIHMLVFHTMLRQHGYGATLLVPAHSALDHYLTQRQISHYTTNIDKFNRLRPLYNFLLGWCIQTLCKKEDITIINCNNRSEVAGALTAKKHHATSVIFTRHVPDPFAIQKIKEVDAIVAVSPYITPYLESENRIQNLGIRTICYIPPFFDAHTFLAYTPTETRADFFKNNFGINITTAPVITMIANFYQDLSHKNHPLLFDAIKILVQKNDARHSPATANKPVQVMLAGEGGRREYLQNLVRELGLENYVHFLGFTDKIPGLLYHSDVFVLSSSKEASPLVYREAGLMKKPAIGAMGTGADAIILQGKTGLLFKNNDAHDLANQIERLLDNPEWAHELGKNAHEHIKQNFSPEAAFTQYCALFEHLTQ